MVELAYTELPRLRSLRPAGGRRRWWLAAAVAMGANVLIVIMLAQISRQAAPSASPAAALLNLHRIDPEIPPPSPMEAVERETQTEECTTEAVVPALPLLDLPAAPSPGLCLPTAGTSDAPCELPVAVPDFAALAGIGDQPVASPGLLPAGSVDSAAVRIGAFDLERYFPRTARSRGIVGSTRIRSRIGADGRVIAVEILDSQPAGVFEQAAERLGRDQRYEPARKAGTAVPSIQDTVIEWSLR